MIAVNLILIVCFARPPDALASHTDQTVFLGSGVHHIRWQRHSGVSLGSDHCGLYRLGWVADFPTDTYRAYWFLQA